MPMVNKDDTPAPARMTLSGWRTTFRRAGREMIIYKMCQRISLISRKFFAGEKPKFVQLV